MGTDDTYRAMNVINQEHGNGWVAYHADNIDVVSALPTSSIGYTVYSVPFASLYTYTASERDMGNCLGHEQFMTHFSFLLPELLRATRPGRNMSIHCMDLPTSKARDGVIGLKDFPGMLIAACERAGWIWHSKVTIWKDPVTAMQRTKALGLLHKQVLKDSCMSRMGIPDYVLTFRSPGDNEEPVSHEREDFPVSLWQQWASPIWSDIDPSDTLQYMSAREDADERHICPLQLEVYRRCMTLWSNPGDTILEPFGGIGSGGHVALGGKGRSGSLDKPRKVVLCELKESYYRQAVANLRRVEPGAKGSQETLF